MPNHDLAGALRAERARADLSQAEASARALSIADELGLPKTGLSAKSLMRYERGMRTPSVETVRVLALVYDVEIAALAPTLPKTEVAP